MFSSSIWLDFSASPSETTMWKRIKIFPRCKQQKCSPETVVGGGGGVTNVNRTFNKLLNNEAHCLLFFVTLWSLDDKHKRNRRLANCVGAVHGSWMCVWNILLAVTILRGPLGIRRWHTTRPHILLMQQLHVGLINSTAAAVDGSRLPCRVTERPPCDAAGSISPSVRTRDVSSLLTATLQ